MLQVQLADGTVISGETEVEFEQAVRLYKSVLGEQGQAKASTPRKSQDKAIVVPEGAVIYGSLKANKTVRGVKLTKGMPVIAKQDKAGNWFYVVENGGKSYRVGQADAVKGTSTKSGNAKTVVDRAEITVAGRNFPVRISQSQSRYGAESTVLHFLETETWTAENADLRKVLFATAFRPSKWLTRKNPDSVSSWWVNTHLSSLAEVQAHLDTAAD